MKTSEHKDIIENLEMIRNLLVLLLENSGVKMGNIAKVFGISPGRLSQILNPKKYYKK